MSVARVRHLQRIVRQHVCFGELTSAQQKGAEYSLPGTATAVAVCAT